MNLDDAKKQTISQWLEAGLKLSDIQKKLVSDFGISMTYMDLRFLLDDLKLKPRDKEVAPVAQDIKPAQASEVAGEEDLPADPALGQEAGLATGNVSVTVDQLARPGTMISGSVTFSDGKSAEWYLDQTGRLGVAPKEKGYKPSQPDIIAFQTELQNQMAKLGF